jgi:beta-galactosidase
MGSRWLPLILSVLAFVGELATAGQSSWADVPAKPKLAVADPKKQDAPQRLDAVLAGLVEPMPRFRPRPQSVAGVAEPRVSLNGSWRFNPAPPAGFFTFDADGVKKWPAIRVPSEWTSQGFEPAAGRAAYWRRFDVPDDWKGQCILLRFDAVYSACDVWVNGRRVGSHTGAFVPFEIDVTRHVAPGKNTLALAVKNDSIADELASGSDYAAHPLGGITRKVTLLALPPVHVAEQYATTTFDPQFRNATLHVHLELANTSNAEAGDAVVSLTLENADARPTVARAPAIQAGRSVAFDVAIPVAAPRPWDSEHPNLYTLRTELRTGDTIVETLRQRVGFRQIEIRGNQVFVNNRPVKLRGVNRHETHPLLGRTLTPELCRQDAELFRAANVNYIRTSHYPPSEEFLDACDELGLFVECEAALCWTFRDTFKAVQGRWALLAPEFFSHLLLPSLRNVAANRSHPCVFAWSLANESPWNPLYAEVERRVRRADPSRMTSYHDQCWGTYDNYGSQAQLANFHYPALDGPARCDNENRPVLFGEYCHVQTYNDREWLTDPGVRDGWGKRFGEMVDSMYQHPGCLGGAIWAGIDDAFQLPRGRVRGCGFWGILDGWRRPKPEYFHVKKAYSPIRVLTRELPADGPTLSIRLENRYNFTDFSEVRVEATLDGELLAVRGRDIPPHGTGEITLAAKQKPRDGQTLVLKFTDPRGLVCESAAIPVGRQVPAALPAALPPSRLTLETKGDVWEVKAERWSVAIDRHTGQVRNARVGGATLLIGGPTLMMLPLALNRCEPRDLAQYDALNNTCTQWSAQSVAAAAATDGSVVVKVEGAYAEAEGRYSLRITPRGELILDYLFTSKVKMKPRQVGMVMYVARDCDTLRWRRKADWTLYPEDHIGRPFGTAKANPSSETRIVPRPAAPTTPWSQDATALGTADFRSSKTNLVSASLRNDNGQGVAVVSEGTQAARAFVDGDRIGWLIAAINTGGAEGFFAVHHAADRCPLKKGSTVKDVVRFRLVE